ncbi:ABC transporter ATP-binding protein [Paenibacillus doosanensis]|uniref:ABC transporter ATP-binding protein n=1 Tax=Paenibacillus doosanensis TaxID=1229154 RepID=UPI00217FE855|nr:ABC transporter ATP-binding protein [Paenibacillus doosanensis]MCS7464251.1 ABC transporter ATP-binding protein [Paenibacillus doosanensis]
MNNEYKANINILEEDNIIITQVNRMSSIKLKITNIGTNTWNAYDKKNPVAICYRIKSENQVLSEGIRTKLPYNVSPGESIEVRANYIVSQRCENIELTWDLVHEGISWFEDYGSNILNTKIKLDRKSKLPVNNIENDVAIQCINLSKRYKLYSNSFGKFMNIFPYQGQRHFKSFWALKDINFKVLKGETYGIIGFNGSGKSTLLSILAQTKQQTDGEFIVNGRIAALLELGAGFHPELSGRENVILNSHLHGISRSEMLTRLESIQEFASIGDFFDKPVKSYSSGMFVRLAFSLAINVDPDVLIIDEALAVGDEVFQRKCFKKFEEFKAKGKTIIFVSHDLNAIRALCNRVALIYDGNLIYEGTSNDVANYYQKMTLTANLDQLDNSEKKEKKDIRYGNGKAKITSFKLLDENGEESSIFKTGKAIQIEVEAVAEDFIEEPVLGVLFKTINGVEVFGSNSKILGCKIHSINSKDFLRYTFKFPMHLNEGTYFLSLGITDQANGESITVDRLVDVTFFRVISTLSCLGLANLNTGAEIKGHVNKFVEQ